MRKKRKEIKKTYALPGELIYTGNKVNIKTSLIHINYSEKKIAVTNNYEENKEDNNLVIINGLNDTNLIKELGEKLNLHKLILEDILNTTQNIKILKYKEKIFVTIKDFLLDNQKKKLIYNQVSFVLNGNYLFIFIEEENRVINIIKDRLLDKKGVIREKNTEYLLFSILDLYVDTYMFIISEIEEKILEFEEEININPEDIEIKEIFELKKNVVTFKKNTFYLREMLKKIVSDEVTFDKEKKIYFEDLYDKSIKIYDYADECKEDINELVSYHMTQLSNNMNKIMKVLTFISTIFIPISFLAGLYGMNFEYMPELNFKYSYPLLLLTMFCIVLIMLRFFKKKKWF